jgi:hypothetical protein
MKVRDITAAAAALVLLPVSASAQGNVFEGEWLREYLPYEGETGSTKLFVNADQTVRTGDTARTRLLLVDEVVINRVSWTMWDASFNCAEETMRLITRRLYDADGVLLAKQEVSPEDHSVGEPGDLWRVLFDFTCHGKNASLHPIIGDVQSHARGAFVKARERDPYEGMFD